jgi:large subunit ribosomal protein L30
MAVKRTPAQKEDRPKRELRLTLVRSVIGYPQRQRETVRGLGLRKINSQVVRPDRPEIRGMIAKVSHLVKVEVVEK